jgi:O-antigen/teichoic acid export membrane protein
MSAEPSVTPVPHAELAGGRGRTQRLFGNALIYTLGNAALQVLSAFAAPILSRLLVPSAYGIWSMANALAGGLNQVYGLALHGAVTRFYFDHEADQAEQRRFQGSIFSLVAAWAAALSILLTLLGPWIVPAAFSDFAFVPYGLLTIWISFLSVLTLVPKAIWAAAERSKSFVAIETGASALFTLSSLALVAFTSLGVMGLFWGRLLSLAVVAAPCLLLWFRTLGVHWHWPSMAKAIAFSLPLLPHLLAHWLLNMSDRILIERMLGLQAVGTYAVAYGFIELVNTVAVSLNRAWVPQFTRAYANKDFTFVARSNTYFLAVVLAASVAGVVLSPTLIRTLFARSYIAAAEIGPIIAAGGFFQGTYYLYAGGLFYAKKNRLIPVITVFSGVLNVLLNLWWIPRFGIAGAAWSTLIGYAVLMLGMRSACLRVAPLPFERARVAKLFLASALTVVVALAMDGRIDPWLEFPLKIGILALGVLALTPMRFWSQSELAWLRARLRSRGNEPH